MTVMGNAKEGTRMEMKKKEGEWEKQRNMLIFPSPCVKEI